MSGSFEILNYTMKGHYDTMMTLWQFAGVKLYITWYAFNITQTKVGVKLL